MEFIWKGKNPKIKNSTLPNDYEYDSLKKILTTFQMLQAFNTLG